MSIKPNDPRRLRIFDSTLRDGEQAPGNAMNPDQKLTLALAIEAVGVDTIEAGFPSSSPADFTATELISQALTTAKVATLNRAAHRDIECAAKAGGVDRHQIQIMATGSEIHLEHKRGISRAEAVREIEVAIRFASSLGFTDISLGIEDATRGSDDLLRGLIDVSLAEGARTLTLADTTGCLIPHEYAALVRRVRSWVPDDVVVATHCHDDMGLALANALAGVGGGADEVQCTLAGIGERAGNTSLEELAAVLHYKKQQLGRYAELETEYLYPLYHVLSDIVGLPSSRTKSIFGQYAFATLAGIHQAGMLRNPTTYEYVEPSLFGRDREILVGRHSGKNVIRNIFTEIGEAVDEAILESLYNEYVADNSAGVCISLDDLRLVVCSRLARTSVTGV